MSKLTRQSCFSSHHWPEPSKLLKPQQNSICATGLTEKTLRALPTLQFCIQTIGKDLAVTIISHKKSEEKVVWISVLCQNVCMILG